VNRSPFTLFTPTLVERSNANACQAPDPVEQRRRASWASRVRRVATAVLLMALLVGAVVLVRLLTYMPALSPAIKHLMPWK
jgi:hypothetical protein